MSDKISLRFYGDRPVRAIWDDENSKWWFSVLDIIAIFNAEEDYTKTRNYWKYLKTKMRKIDVKIITMLFALSIYPCLCMAVSPFQSAIDSIAALEGGGTLVIPAGEYVTGTLRLKSGVNLHLEKDAMILGSINPYDYDGYVETADDVAGGVADKCSKPQFALIVARDAHNISITGEGTIDGRGLDLALAIDSLHHIGERIDPNYNTRRMRPALRPKLLDFDSVDSLLIEDVSLRSSASWGMSLSKCNNVLIKDIDFVNRAYWNNDGIDVADCHHVVITGCDINSADDGIVLKSFDPEDGNEDIHISDCRIASSANAVKMGTESFGGFRNITIKNIKVRDTFRSAIALETVDGAVLENVDVDSITAVNTGNPFFIRLGHRRGVKPGSLSNVTIRNLSCDVPFGRPDSEYDLRGPDINTIHNPFPASITGIPGHLVKNIRLENITVSYPGRGTKGMAYIGSYRYNAVPEQIDAYPEFHMFGELPAWGLFVRHVDGLSLDNVVMTVREPDYRPAMVASDDVHNLTGNIQ